MVNDGLRRGVIFGVGLAAGAGILAAGLKLLAPKEEQAVTFRSRQFIPPAGRVILASDF